MAVNKRRFVSGKVSCSCSMPGVWRAVAHNEGCLVIYHAPASCAHITSDMDRNRHYRLMSRKEYMNYAYQAPLITSNMGKKESIFGGVDTLRQCIDHVIATYKPMYIVVADSCMSGVIGDDSGAICLEKEREYGLPIIHVDVHGFLDGEYYGGYISTAKALIDRFMVPMYEKECLPKNPKGVTLLGEKDGPASSAIRDFCQLLEGFGLEVNAQFPGYSSLEDMAHIAQSTYTMVIGGSPKAYTYLEELADYMAEKIHTIPFRGDYPVGWRATQSWIQELGAFLGQEEKVQSVLDTLWHTFHNSLEEMEELLQKYPMTLCIGKVMQEFHLDWVLEWIALGKLPLTRVILLDSLPPEEVATYKMMLDACGLFLEVEEETEETRIDPEQVVLTTTELDMPHVRQLFLPLLPPIGPRGFIQMYKKLSMLCKRSPGKGVLFYGW